MRLGVHCSVRGGLVLALEEAHRLGCDTVQIFTRSPRMWRAGKIKPEDAEAFRRARLKFNIDPVVVHTPYLPNLCTSDEALYARSYRALLEDLENCRLIGADYLVIHPGAYSEGSSPQEGIRRLTDAISRGLKQVQGNVIVLLENVAGGGRRMGMAFEELAAMRAGMEEPGRVGICLDTAHTLAAGFPFSAPEEVYATLAEFDRTIGLGHLKVIHANDSKAIRGSHRDLHEHIGKGHVGQRAFKALLHHPALSRCAVILETPKDSPEADPRNLKLMRQLMRNSGGQERVAGLTAQTRALATGRPPSK
jgi:deoxyribonuclease-4